MIKDQKKIMDIIQNIWIVINKNREIVIYLTFFYLYQHLPLFGIKGRIQIRDVELED